MGVLQNLQKFRVRYGSVTELTEVPGAVTRAYRTHMNIYTTILIFGHSVRSFSFQYAIRGTRILGQKSFVRAPVSWSGSNAPRPAVSVPHLDVNADESDG